jgi:hypothetical protein
MKKTMKVMVVPEQQLQSVKLSFVVRQEFRLGIFKFKVSLRSLRYPKLLQTSSCSSFGEEIMCNYQMCVSVFQDNYNENNRQ